MIRVLFLACLSVLFCSKVSSADDYSYTYIFFSTTIVNNLSAIRNLGDVSSKNTLEKTRVSQFFNNKYILVELKPKSSLELKTLNDLCKNGYGYLLKKSIMAGTVDSVSGKYEVQVFSEQVNQLPTDYNRTFSIKTSTP